MMTARSNGPTHMPSVDRFIVHSPSTINICDAVEHSFNDFAAKIVRTAWASSSGAASDAKWPPRACSVPETMLVLSRCERRHRPEVVGEDVYTDRSVVDPCGDVFLGVVPEGGADLGVGQPLQSDLGQDLIAAAEVRVVAEVHEQFVVCQLPHRRVAERRSDAQRELGVDVGEAVDGLKPARELESLRTTTAVNRDDPNEGVTADHVENVVAGHRRIAMRCDQFQAITEARHCVVGGRGGHAGLVTEELERRPG